jgi:cell division protein FtsL
VASRLPPMSFKAKRKYSPSIQAILLVSVVLFILFLWLNFFLAQQIELLGREIQHKTELLEQRERQKDALTKKIAETGSERNMARRARELGYRPRVPTFLVIDQPLPQPTLGAEGSGQQIPARPDGDQDAVYSSYTLWDNLVRPFGAPETAP